MPRPVATWVLATLFGQSDAKVWATEYWYASAGGSPPPSFDPGTLASDFFAIMSTPVAGSMYSGFALQGCSVEVNFGTGTFGAKYYSTLAGSISGTPLPEDVCAVVRRNSAHGGRSYTGVNRYSALADSEAVGSYLSSSGMTAMQSIATATLTHLISQTITYIPQIYSRKLNLLTPVVGMEVIKLLGTVRRRRPRF